MSGMKTVFLPDYSYFNFLQPNAYSPGSKARVQFTPILRGYIVLGRIEEGEILRGQITSPLLFKENLASLGEATDWLLAYDPGSGTYNIRRD